LTQIEAELCPFGVCHQELGCSDGLL